MVKIHKIISAVHTIQIPFFNYLPGEQQHYFHYCCYASQQETWILVKTYLILLNTGSDPGKFLFLQTMMLKIRAEMVLECAF